MHVLNFPLVVFALSLIVLWFSTQAGVFLVRRVRPLAEDAREDYTVVLTATLTLLALIIGFTFSMAVSRYDQRKEYEDHEANAIGTEYLRAELLTAEDAARVQELLRKYLEQRVLFYATRGSSQLSQVNAHTLELQGQMWSTVKSAATAKSSPTTALAVSGMNDVLNSAGHTQAAWRNRIPKAAWILMAAIAVCCTVLVGYGVRRTGTGLVPVLPLVLSIAFFLIADIDSPRRGAIRLHPENLLSLSQSFR